MAVGSVATASYGNYRTTDDVDVILLLTAENASRVADAFPQTEFYCPPADVIAIEASRPERGHFNLIHHATVFKADIYLARNDPLIGWALAHRRCLEVEDTDVWVAPPEYVIIGKLEFFREGGSEKHIRDIQGILKGAEIDRSFLQREIATRGLQEAWNAVEIRP
ncbi:MAG: hypothetical protein ABR611_09350 [Chthoniobacterales bacterium]